MGVTAHCGGSNVSWTMQGVVGASGVTPGGVVQCPPSIVEGFGNSRLSGWAAFCDRNQGSRISVANVVRNGNTHVPSSGVI